MYYADTGYVLFEFTNLTVMFITMKLYKKNNKNSILCPLEEVIKTYPGKKAQEVVTNAGVTANNSMHYRYFGI
jgi:hypothetical protein